MATESHEQSQHELKRRLIAERIDEAKRKGVMITPAFLKSIVRNTKVPPTPNRRT